MRLLARLFAALRTIVAAAGRPARRRRRSDPTRSRPQGGFRGDRGPRRSGGRRERKRRG